MRSESAPAISDLTGLELFSAVARKVRAGGISVADGQRITAAFLSHLASALYTQIGLEQGHYRLARDWLGRFTLPLRSLDALHLAVAAASGSRLVTADRVLARCAKALGVKSLLVQVSRGQNIR